MENTKVANCPKCNSELKDKSTTGSMDFYYCPNGCGCRTVRKLNPTELMGKMSLKQLVEMFEETETREKGAEVATVRGWIMDELERRDEGKFETWVDSNEGSPRNYFM